MFCVSFPICQQKHKIDGKTTACKTNPLKIKKQTCSRPLLAHVAGLLFCAYTLHGGSVIDFSLSKNIWQSWKELPTPLEGPEHCPFRGRGYLSFLLAFCYFSRVRFSKKLFGFLKTLGFFRFLDLAFLLAVQLLRCDLHRRRAQLAKHAKPCFVCVLIYDIFPPCFQLPQVCPTPKAAQRV